MRSITEHFIMWLVLVTPCASQRFLFSAYSWKKKSDSLYWTCVLPHHHYPPPPLSPRFIADYVVIRYGISLWSVLVNYIPSQSLAQPQPTHLGSQVRNREGVDTMKALVAKALTCYQHCLSTNLKHSTIQTAVKKANSIPNSTNAVTFNV